jgi:hypothetical protein
MRPSTTTLKPPGIYMGVAEPAISPLEIADIRTAGFVGLTERGPIDAPEYITSWDEFVEIFGNEPSHYLTHAVEGYFRNGGVACWIVRIAHAARGGAEPTPEHASCAELVIVDDWKKPTLRVFAQTEGEWGNNIYVRFEHAASAQTLLTRDLDVGAGEAQVSSVRGFEVGQLVRIFDRENEDFVVLSEVGEKRVAWTSATPVNRRYRAASPTRLEVIEFTLHAALRERREVFSGLQLSPASRRYAPKVVAAESRLVRLDDIATKSPPPHNLPRPAPAERLAAGRDGLEALTPEDFIGFDHGPAERAGIMSLVEIDDAVTLLAPDAMVFLDRNPGPSGELKAQRVQDAMIDLCENLKDRFAILDCPRTRDIELVKRWRRRTDSSYCAYYWPWLKVPIGEQDDLIVPPSGAVAGAYARRDTEMGAHHPPANIGLEGVLDVSLRVTEDHLGDLNHEAVNVIRNLRGIRPWGVRTSSSDPDWRYINVRRLFIMLRRAIEAGTTWVPFEPNTPNTWETVEDLVRAFLGELYGLGMFAGGKPEDSFYVRCDEETNPDEVVNQGMMVCEIGIAPAIPAEFIVIRVVENMEQS